MKQSIRFWLACGITLCSCAAISPTQALPVPDATLPNNSVVTNLGNMSTITGGTRAGRNLFHSFSEFSVPTKGEAFFNNALDIQNIISRVTGSSISNIDGLIRANGKANLFLINPNGIIFGPNAQLNIGGSFVGSTANSLKFADGTEFSATAARTTPLLTISVPIGLQYGGTAGSIVNQSSATNSRRETVGLQVKPGNTLALVGGDVKLDGGTLTAPGGRVEVGGVASSGTVGLSVDGNNLGLSFPDSVARADVYLTNRADVNVRAGGGGTIAVNAQNLNVAGESKLRAGIASGLGSVDSKAGDIEINATGAITLTDDSFISNTVQQGGVGKGGDVNITTGSLSLTNGAGLYAATRGQGDAGSIKVQASDTVSLDGKGSTGSATGAFTSVARGAMGKGGNINITTGSLSLSNGAKLAASTLGQGDAGSVKVQANDSVSLGSEAKIFSNVESTVVSEAVGKGGDIDIQSRSLSLTGGAVLDATTSGQGNAGNIRVNVLDSVNLSGVSLAGGFSSGFFSGTSDTASGQGGEIAVQTNALRVSDGAVLSARTLNALRGGDIIVDAKTLEVTGGGQILVTAFSSGDAGNVIIDVPLRITLSGSGPTFKDRFNKVTGAYDYGTARQIIDPVSAASGIFANTYTNSTGQGGAIRITTGQLLVRDGAQVSASTSGLGSGGTINLTANTFDVANGGRLLTTTEGTGRAGDINLKVLNNVTLQGQGSGIFANTATGSTGSGGTISIDPSRFSITNGAGIAVNSQGTGQGGSLNVQANYLTLDNKAFLSATTNSSEGGNITLNVPSLLLMRHNSGISASAGVASGNGNGGNITINTPFIVSAPLENSDITANAGSGKGGNVNILARGIFWLEPLSLEQLQTLRPNDPDPSKLPTNDITAISQQGGPSLSGQVNINTSGIDPSRGLVALPAVVVDKSGLIAQGCAAGDGTTGSQFIVTGRGGLPPNPSEPLSSDAVWSDTRLPAVMLKKHRSNAFTTPQSSSTAPVPIVPATGWVFNGKGEVTLTASAPSDTIQVPRFTPATCHAQ